MKAIILIGALLVHTSAGQKPNQAIDIYVLNFNHESPVAISEEIFWGKGMSRFMDTVKLTDNNFVNFICKAIETFQPLNREKGIENKVAIITKQAKGAVDTFYTYDFEYYRSGEKFFRDSSKQLFPMLSGFIRMED